MDARPVAPPPSPPSWKLADSVATQTQGFVVTGFGALPTGRALFLEFTWPGDRGPNDWFNRLLAIAPITSAVPPDKGDCKAQARAASIAFSSTGLRRMGWVEESIASFSRPFQEGMFQEDRLRRLGDRRDGEWLGTVVNGGPVWGGTFRCARRYRPCRIHSMCHPVKRPNSTSKPASRACPAAAVHAR
jgi:hypothetical protein